MVPIIIGLSVFSSCNDWLNITPANTVSAEDLYKTGYGFRNALNGIYLKLAESNLYGENLSWGFISAVGQEYAVLSQEQQYNQAFIDASELQYETSQTLPIVKELWESSYSVIANINKLISEIKNADENSFAFGKNEKDLIMAEALALRAMVHFDLLRMFAPAPITSPSDKYIPYRKEYSSDVGVTLTVQEFLENVIKDLNEAEAPLKMFDTEYHPKAMYASNMYDNDPSWNARYRLNSSLYVDEMGIFFWSRGLRLNYMALLALKARVCMYAGSDYEKIAEGAAMELYNKFYEDNRWIGFTPEGNITCVKNLRHAKVVDDVIFGLYQKNLAVNYDSKLWTSQNSVRIPLANIEELYNDDNVGIYTDYRLSFLMDRTNESRAKYYSLKYLPSTESVVEAMENPIIPVIRFSEVCHILAEINCNNNRISESIKFLETVRVARGAVRSLSLTVKNQKDMQAEIIKDIRKEVVGEGQSFFYYKRLNISKVKSADESGNMIDLSGSFVLPIPESENPF